MLNRILLSYIAMAMLFAALVWLSLEMIQVSYGFVNMPQFTNVPEEAAQVALFNALKWIVLFVVVAVLLGWGIIRIADNSVRLRNTALCLLVAYAVMTGYYMQRAHKDCIALEQKYSTAPSP